MWRDLAKGKHHKTPWVIEYPEQSGLDSSRVVDCGPGQVDRSQATKGPWAWTHWVGQKLFGFASKKIMTSGQLGLGRMGLVAV